MPISDLGYMVDISMPVYNHEKYLIQAIEGVLNQKCDFKYRLLIGEDCSTDRSREIVRRYEQANPDIIKVLYSQKNMGAYGNGRNLHRHCTAPYIAVCEGDDYWIDERKLHKQVGFLEAHPDYTACFSSAEVINEMGYAMTDFPVVETPDISTADIIKSVRNLMPTASLLFRNIIPTPYPKFIDEAMSTDITLQLFLADKGPIRYFPEAMVAYRHHPGGISKSRMFIEECEERLFQTLIAADEYFHFKYTHIFRERLHLMTKIGLTYGLKELNRRERVVEIARILPRYFKYSQQIDMKELFSFFIGWCRPGYGNKYRSTSQCNN